MLLIGLLFSLLAAISLCSPVAIKASDSPVSTRHYALNNLPTDALKLVFPFLRRDLASLASSCRTLRTDFFSFVKNALKSSLPEFSGSNQFFNAAVYVYFLDYLTREFPEMINFPVSEEDLTGVCYLHGLDSNDTALIKAAEFMKQSLGFDNNAHDLQQNISDYSKRAFHRSLFFTAEYLLAKKYITEGQYYTNVADFSKNPAREDYFYRILEFDFFAYANELRKKFDAEFAVLILGSKKVTGEIKNRVFELALMKVKSAPSFSPTLIKIMASRPLVARDILSEVSERDTIGAVLSAVPSDFFGDYDPRWKWRRYLFFMDRFEAEEPKENVPFTVEALKFLPFMNLDRPCHFEAFTFMISQPVVNISPPENDDWKENLFYTCARSRVHEYWQLVCRHALVIPRLNMRDKFISHALPLSAEMISALSTRLLIGDFLEFTSEEEWRALAIGFNAVDISLPIEVDSLSDLRMNIPKKWRDGRSWPILHLSLMANHFLAFKAVLKHPQFSLGMVKDLVLGLSLVEWFDQMDEDGICGTPNQKYSYSFRAVLNLRIKELSG